MPKYTSGAAASTVKWIKTECRWDRDDCDSWIHAIQTWNEHAVTNATGSWPQWIIDTSESTTGTLSQQAQLVWQVWHTNSATTGNVVMYQAGRTLEAERMIARGRVSPEERAKREAEQALRQAEWDKQEAARKEANRKAEVLLRSCLNQQQLDDLDKKKCFFLHTGGRKYRVDRGQHGNVKLLDERDRVVESYCIQPQGGLPDADAMLAQKLLLETDPDSFRKISNVTIAGRGFFPGITAPQIQFQIPQIAL